MGRPICAALQLSYRVVVEARPGLFLAVPRTWMLEPLTGTPLIETWCAGPLACPRPAEPKAHGADAPLAEIEVATSADRREIDWFLLAHGLSSSLARGSGPRSPLAGDKAETKNPSGCRGVSRPWLLRHKPYRPVSGLALAPWRLHQVAGRFIGPEPSTPLLIVIYF